ncbi:hypothetical protein AAIH49_34175, partial [Pseudomonas aeruginosa]
KRFTITGESTRVNIHCLIHLWLGKTWLIAFVVSVLTEAANIDDDVAPEGVSPFARQFHYLANSVNVIAINVDNWGRYHFGNIGAVP